MKFLLLTTFVLLVRIHFCQYSISVGPYRHIDNFPENGFRHCLGKTQLQRYNGFTLQGDYQKTFFRTYVELAHMASSFELVEKTYYSYFSNTGSFYDKREYHSKVSFDALCVKYGIGILLNKGDKSNYWYNLSGNMFFQYDKLIRKTESNQVMYRTLGSLQNTQSGSQYTTTDCPPDYTPYKLVEFQKNLYQFGIEMKNRFGFRNCFAELSAVIGLKNQKRTQTNYSTAYSDNPLNENSTWSFGISLKLGYLLQLKKSIVPTNR